VCLIGGFDQFHGLQDGTPELIRQMVHQCFQEAGPGGGYIMAPSGHFFYASEENCRLTPTRHGSVCMRDPRLHPSWVCQERGIDVITSARITLAFSSAQCMVHTAPVPPGPESIVAGLENCLLLLLACHNTAANTGKCASQGHRQVCAAAGVFVCRSQPSCRSSRMRYTILTESARSAIIPHRQVIQHRSHHRLDLRIAEHAVNVINSVLRRVGDEPALVEGMTPYPHLEAKRLQVLYTPFDAVGKHTCPTPGGTDKANCISGLQSWWSNHSVSF